MCFQISIKSSSLGTGGHLPLRMMITFAGNDLIDFFKFINFGKYFLSQRLLKASCVCSGSSFLLSITSR